MIRKTAAALILICIALSMTSCGKPAGFSQDELDEIHANEKALREQLINITWHETDEPTRALRFFDDGTYEEYYGGSVRELERYGDEVKWEILFCSSYNADTDYLETDSERALEYYNYNVVYHSYLSGELKTYTMELSFDGDRMELGRREYYAGQDLLEKMPEDLTVMKDLLNHVWYIDGLEYYILFFDNGYSYATYGVFADGLSNGSYVYKWGVNESEGLFCMMDYYYPDDVKYEDVQLYKMTVTGSGAGLSMLLTDIWSDGAFSRSIRNVDGQDDSARALLNSYESLRSWVTDIWVG